MYLCLNRFQLFLENGLIDKVKKKYLVHIDKCLLRHNKPEKTTPLKLIDLSSAFYFLFIGFGLALMAFLREVISEKRAKKNGISNLG